VALRSQAVLSRASLAIAAPAILYILGLGFVVLFGAPRAGQGFWTLERLFYGALPLIAIPVLLAIALRRWFRLFGRKRYAVLSTCGIVLLAIAVDTLAFLMLGGRQDERIQVDWREEVAIFRWGTGQVSIPAGFSYTRQRGMDTFIGRFTSPDGRLVIEHDIGELAAEHGSMGQFETLSHGSRVRFGSGEYVDDRGITRHFFKLSFPDASCANFSLEAATDTDGDIMLSMARSFRPAGWLPSFVRPLLPEVLRSDCRYRLKLPSSL